MQLEAVELQEPAEERMDWKSEPPLISKGQGIPAPPWMGWESSPLAPRRCRWRVRLEQGPYTLEGGIPGSVTILIGCEGRNTSSNCLA